MDSAKCGAAELGKINKYSKNWAAFGTKNVHSALAETCYYLYNMEFIF